MPSESRAETVRELVDEATVWLREAGIRQPRREARLLMQHAMGWTATDFIRWEESRIDLAHATAFRHAAGARSERLPLAHITGEVRFAGLDLKSDPRALIPRADSEIVVEAALERLPRGLAEPRLADLGTGSGCLLLAILAAHPRASGTGIDISAQALALAEENGRITGLDDRAMWRLGGWADANWEGVDMIVSNPPYIPTGEVDALEPEVSDHDPRLALDGGADGLDAYRELSWLARDRLRPGAWLVVEIGHDQAEAVSALFEAIALEDVSVVKDYGGRDRVVCGRKPR